MFDDLQIKLSADFGTDFNFDALFSISDDYVRGFWNSQNTKIALTIDAI